MKHGIYLLAAFCFLTNVYASDSCQQATNTTCNVTGEVRWGTGVVCKYVGNLTINQASGNKTEYTVSGTVQGDPNEHYQWPQSTTCGSLRIPAFSAQCENGHIVIRNSVFEIAGQIIAKSASHDCGGFSYTLNGRSVNKSISNVDSMTIRHS